MQRGSEEQQGGENAGAGAITLVLTLTISDAARALVLLGSLRHWLQAPGTRADAAEIVEVLVIAPESQVFALRALEGALPGVPLRLISEDMLVPRPPRAGRQVDTYALAMLLKLQAAQLVSTPFYLTVDADVVATRPLQRSHLFDAWGRAFFDAEPQSVHPHWWEGAANTLRLRVPPAAAFGVTPALLSTPAAQLVLATVSQALRDRCLEDQLPACGASARAQEQAQQGWESVLLSLWGPGFWWSEYTLYTTVLHAHRLFDALHAAHRGASTGSSHRGQRGLSCHSVWFADELPWNASGAFGDKDGCPFSVVQSSAGEGVARLAEATSRQLRSKLP